MRLSPGSSLECQMALIKFATSQITEHFRLQSRILKFKVKIEKWFSLVSDGSIDSIFLRIHLNAG